jgi:hypothetical protein
MSFNPAGTKWSVAGFDSNGALTTAFHPTPWEFHRQSLNAGNYWSGGYQPMPGCDNAFIVETISSGTVADNLEVYFLTPDRFIATKGGALYRFGKKL